MAGIRYPELDINYYLGDRAMRDKAIVRVMNWAENAGVSYIMFRMQDEMTCDAAISCTEDFRAYADTEVLRAGPTVGPGSDVVDLEINGLWIFAARLCDSAVWILPGTWFIWRLNDDTVSYALQSRVCEVQDARQIAREMYGNERLSHDSADVVE